MCVIISHRGYCVDLPEYENTSHAMLRSISFGVRHLEFDVRMTVDNEIVLFHNNTMDVGGNKISVAKMKYSDIKRLQPNTETITEFLGKILNAITPDIQLTFVVDVKTSHMDSGFDELLMRRLRDVDDTHNLSFVVTSYNHRFVASFKQIVRNNKLNWECGYIVYHVPTKEELMTYPFEWIGFDTNTMTEPVVKDIHALGKKVFVYTPNSKDEFDRCARIGVDGMYVDDIKLFMK